MIIKTKSLMNLVCWSESVWSLTPKHPWIANINGNIALLGLIYTTYQLIHTLIIGELP
jgi:hypothetical protein